MTSLDHPSAGSDDPTWPDSSPPLAWRPTRRRILAAGMAAGVAGVSGVGVRLLTAAGPRPGAPKTAPASSPRPSPGGPPKSATPSPALDGEGILVLISMYGGNDGLNTVVPATDPAYLTARPTIGYTASEVLPMGEGLGLNPRLGGFHQLWQAGRLAVVRGVGYPNPNLSHFASMAIWQTASLADNSSTGWLGRWLDGTGSDPLRAISMGAVLPVALRGASQAASAVPALPMSIPEASRLGAGLATLGQPGRDRSGLAGAVGGTIADLLSCEERVDSLLARQPGGTVSDGVVSPAANGPGGVSAASATGSDQLPQSVLTSELGDVARLIIAGAPTRVYHASLATFDTHAGERADQERALSELDGAVRAFFASLTAAGADRRVVLVAYSEFGRRVAENSSGGTDHGTAGVVLVAGTPVRGGVWYGEQPSLRDLDPNGNLRWNIDFRSVYSSLLGAVLGVDAAPILGGTFPTLAFV